MKIIDNNKKAYHEYFIEDTVEAGIMLTGGEVKSARAEKAVIKDSYVMIRNGEAFLVGANFTPYEKGSFFNAEARRDRKLLLHKDEIPRLSAKVKTKGVTLVPTKLYFKDSLLKIEIGLARGKKLHDKRDVIAGRDIERQTQRDIKEYLKK